MDLEEVWRIREEEIYPKIFGGDRRGIFALTPERFKNQFGVTECDPRWMTYGVIEFAPTETRPFWLYITSGHSNPWDQDPKDYDPASGSGSGVEFMFASSEQRPGQSSSFRKCWPLIFCSALVISAIGRHWMSATEFRSMHRSMEMRVL